MPAIPRALLRPKKNEIEDVRQEQHRSLPSLKLEARAHEREQKHREDEHPTDVGGANAFGLDRRRQTGSAGNTEDVEDAREEQARLPALQSSARTEKDRKSKDAPSINGTSKRTSRDCTDKGRTSAASPRITATLNRFEPTTLSTAISPAPDNAALIETASSGALVPNATMVSPATRGLSPKRRPIAAPPRTSPSAPAARITNETKIRKSHESMSFPHILPRGLISSSFRA